MTRPARHGARGAHGDDLSAAARESATLPAIFITVAIAGGFRAVPPGGQFTFLPPPLIHLVLALLVMSMLVRSGVLVPHSLMNERRGPLGNLSGAAVLATLFFASAQVLNAMTPEAGLLHLIFVVVFALLFWNTLAIAPGPGAALRSLLLILGTALVAKHVVLASLFAPEPSITKRVLTALLSGVSFGGITHEPSAALTGYVAFAAIALYFVGLVLVPRPVEQEPPTGLAVSAPGDELEHPRMPSAR